MIPMGSRSFKAEEKKKKTTTKPKPLTKKKKNRKPYFLCFTDGGEADHFESLLMPL